MKPLLRNFNFADIIGTWPFAQNSKGSAERPYLLSGALKTAAQIISIKKEPAGGFDLNGKTINIYLDAIVAPYQVLFAADDMDVDDVVTAINTATSGYLATVAYNYSGFLLLKSKVSTGDTGYIRITNEPGSEDALDILGLYSETESWAGELSQTPHTDPTRQITLPHQVTIAHGEQFSADAFNRLAVQMATASERTTGLLDRKRVAIRKDTSVGNPDPDNYFQLMDTVYTGAAGQAMDTLIAILDENGNEILHEVTADLVTGITGVAIATDAGTKVMTVTCAGSFVAGDATGNRYMVFSGTYSPALPANLTNIPFKITRYINATNVEIMNVDESTGLRIEYTGSGGGAKKISITPTQLQVLGFYKESTLTNNVQDRHETRWTGSVTRIEKNNRIYCSAADFLEVAVGDQLTWASGTALAPFSNNGDYRVAKMIDEKTLELMDEDGGPVTLNPTEPSPSGTITVKTDGEFWTNPYVKLNMVIPVATITDFYPVYLGMSTVRDSVTANPAALSGDVRYLQAADFKVQQALIGIVGPSADSLDDVLAYLYADQRRNMEDIYFKLDRLPLDLASTTIPGSNRIGCDAIPAGVVLPGVDSGTLMDQIHGYTDESMWGVIDQAFVNLTLETVGDEGAAHIGNSVVGSAPEALTVVAAGTLHQQLNDLFATVDESVFDVMQSSYYGYGRVTGLAVTKNSDTQVAITSGKYVGYNGVLYDLPSGTADVLSTDGTFAVRHDGSSWVIADITSVGIGVNHFPVAILHKNSGTMDTPTQLFWQANGSKCLDHLSVGPTTGIGAANFTSLYKALLWLCMFDDSAMKPKTVIVKDDYTEDKNAGYAGCISLNHDVDPLFCSATDRLEGLSIIGIPQATGLHRPKITIGTLSSQKAFFIDMFHVAHWRIEGIALNYAGKSAGGDANVALFKDPGSSFVCRDCYINGNNRLYSIAYWNNALADVDLGGEWPNDNPGTLFERVYAENCTEALAIPFLLLGNQTPGGPPYLDLYGNLTVRDCVIHGDSTTRSGSDGSSTGSTLFTAASGGFTFADEGRSITIDGADYTIASYQTATQVFVNTTIPSGSGLSWTVNSCNYYYAFGFNSWTNTDVHNVSLTVENTTFEGCGNTIGHTALDMSIMFSNCIFGDAHGNYKVLDTVVSYGYPTVSNCSIRNTNGVTLSNGLYSNCSISDDGVVRFGDYGSFDNCDFSYDGIIQGEASGTLIRFNNCKMKFDGYGATDVAMLYDELLMNNCYVTNSNCTTGATLVGMHAGATAQLDNCLFKNITNAIVVAGTAGKILQVSNCNVTLPGVGEMAIYATGMTERVQISNCVFTTANGSNSAYKIVHVEGANGTRLFTCQLANNVMMKTGGTDEPIIYFKWINNLLLSNNRLGDTRAVDNSAADTIDRMLATTNVWVSITVSGVTTQLPATLADLNVVA